jgi:hypothetical protein
MMMSPNQKEKEQNKMLLARIEALEKSAPLKGGTVRFCVGHDVKPIFQLKTEPDLGELYKSSTLAEDSETFAARASSVSLTGHLQTNRKEG